MNWTHIHWSSWSDFWLMGGYAFYVWGSLIVTLGLLGIEVALAHAAHRRALREVALMAEIDAESARAPHPGEPS